MNGTAQKALPKSSNGKADAIPLTVAQSRHLTRLVHLISKAEDALDAAQKAADQARTNAGEFVTYCADEVGLTLAPGQMRFDQQSMSFVHWDAPAASQQAQQAAAMGEMAHEGSSDAIDN